MQLESMEPMNGKSFARSSCRFHGPGFSPWLVIALSVWNDSSGNGLPHGADLFTVVTSYYNFANRFGRDWTLTSAAAMMMIVPVIMVFLVLQRRFIEGLTQGGLKG